MSSPLVLLLHRQTADARTHARVCCLPINDCVCVFWGPTDATRAAKKCKKKKKGNDADDDDGHRFFKSLFPCAVFYLYILLNTTSIWKMGV